MGRLPLTLTLEELPLSDCNKFWDKNKAISSYEKFKILSVTGGIPRYHEEIKPALPAEENIKQLCFDTSGILFNEFNQIFTDLFSEQSHTYKKIVTSLSVSNTDRIASIFAKSNFLNMKLKKKLLMKWLKKYYVLSDLVTFLVVRF